MTTLFTQNDEYFSAMTIFSLAQIVITVNHVIQKPTEADQNTNRPLKGIEENLDQYYVLKCLSQSSFIVGVCQARIKNDIKRVWISQLAIEPGYQVSYLWQYGLWSFPGRDTKLERFLAKNQLLSNEIIEF